MGVCECCPEFAGLQGKSGVNSCGCVFHHVVNHIVEVALDSHKTALDETSEGNTHQLPHFHRRIISEVEDPRHIQFEVALEDGALKD